MMRSKIVTVIAVAAALGLAACSSGAGGGGTSGSATSGSNAPAVSAGGSGGSESGAASGNTASGNAGSGSGGSTGTSPSSGAASSVAPAESTSTQSTVTVGGAMDGQTAAWFTAFCTGMAPMAEEMPNIMPTGTVAPDPATMKQQYVTFLNKMGDAMIDTANRLKPLPPPTFDKGNEIAAKLVTALAATGPTVKKSASDLAAAKVSNPEDLSKAMNAASAQMGSQLDAVNLDQYQLDEKTQEAIAKLPACAPLMSSEQSGSTATS